MSRNLKALGLALAAMLAMGAITAVGAQANPNEEGHVVSAFETAEHESSLVTGTDEFEENTLQFTAPAGLVHCEVNEFHGEIAGGTTKEPTVETAFGGPLASQECTAGGFPATVFNNDCHLTFHHAETIKDQEDPEYTTWSVTTDLHCPENVEGIEVKAYSGGAHGFQVCRILVPPQTGLEGVTIHNEANTPAESHDLTATVAVGGIKESQSGLCGSSSGEAEMHGEVTMTAESILREEPIDLYVEHTE